jgi:CubicO group peptidase (beta-lactamase class C family)
VATGQATDPAGLYGIASITKTFTGTAIMQLRDAGRLGLDDPAVRWLPELGAMANPFGPVDLVTIRRMLSHESGLPAEPPGTDWAIPAYEGTPEATLRRAGELSVRFPPHAQHGYSDLAYQWLGEIVTRASGTPSAADLASWISFQLRAYREPAATSPVLDAGSLREMHRPRYLADDQWTQAWGIST